MTGGGLLDYARRAHAAGLCVLPPRQDGSKRPEGAKWEQWQAGRPGEGQLAAWYQGERSGIGFVTGAVSGRLEVLDFDEYTAFELYAELARASGLGPLLDRVMAGYFERTPGGAHLFYRCPEIAGNTKLAQRPKRPDEQKDPHDTVKPLVETRGEGGYIIAAPSNGRVHPDGGAYVLISGGVETIPNVTPAERDGLHSLARTFDQMPRPHAVEPDFADLPRQGERPGDAYNRRASWGDVLEPHGWQPVCERDDVTHWRRPGKDLGISATTNYAGSDLLYVFSTSTGFDAQRGYSKFSAYTLLDHAGDFRAAAQALAAAGYGDAPRRGANIGADWGDAVPAFPIEVLPEALARFVTEAAAALVCPPDFVAVPLLALVGGVVGSAVELEIKPGWVEAAKLYAGIVGRPGDKKSPALGAAVGPVERLQTRLARIHGERMAEHTQALADWEASPRQERGARPTPPAFPHLFTSDCTVEALALMLADAPGLALVRDELSGWVKAMDAYRQGRGGDRQAFLSMWSRAALKVDRKHAPPILVPRSCLSVVGGIQPDILPELGDGAGREDGFVDRLLMAYPDPVRDCWTDESISPDTVAAVDAVFEELRRLALATRATPRRVRFTPDARALWRAWYADHTSAMAADDFPQRLRGPWAKLPSQCGRLALTLHLLHAPARDTLDADTPGAAADLVNYFAAHARRVHRHMSQLRQDLTVRVLGAFQGRGALSTTELHDVLQRNVSAERLRATLEGLEDAGLVVRETRPAKGDGHRAATVWRFTPSDAGITS